MKLRLFIPPLVVLVAGTSWIHSQHQSIAWVERGNAAMRKNIGTAARGRSNDSPKAAEPPFMMIGDESQAPDWRKLLGQMALIFEGRSYQPAPLQKQLAAMSVAELFAALDEIEALEAIPRDRNELTGFFVDALVKKDVEACLTRFVDRLDDYGSGFSNKLNSAFGEWVKQKPGKAAAWMDRQIAAGNFDSRTLDGRSRPRAEFEAMLMQSLLGMNVEYGRSRLAVMPEGQRADVMQGLRIAEMDERELAGYATLVRGQLSPEDSTRIIAQAANLALFDMDYEELSTFLEKLEATPAERAAAVEQHLWHIKSMGFPRTAGRKDFDALRSWISTQSPAANVEEMTGTALASATRREKIGFAEAVAFALDFRQSSGSDEALATFLENQAAGGNRQKITPLLEKISDSKRREKIIGLLGPAPEAPKPP